MVQKNHEGYHQTNIHNLNYLLLHVHTDQKMNYIHNNPVEAGWVEKPKEYLYSSAKNYAGEVGLIDVELIV